MYRLNGLVLVLVRSAALCRSLGFLRYSTATATKDTIFDINQLTMNLSFAIAGLKAHEAAGSEVKLVELGNEMHVCTTLALRCFDLPVTCAACCVTLPQPPHRIPLKQSLLYLSGSLLRRVLVVVCLPATPTLPARLQVRLEPGRRGGGTMTFDVILGHVSRRFRPYATAHAL